MFVVPHFKLQLRNYHVSKMIVHEIKFDDIAVMQIMYKPIVVLIPIGSSRC